MRLAEPFTQSTPHHDKTVHENSPRRNIYIFLLLVREGDLVKQSLSPGMKWFSAGSKAIGLIAGILGFGPDLSSYSYQMA